MRKTTSLAIASGGLGISIFLGGCGGAGPVGGSTFTTRVISEGSIEYSMGKSSLTVHQGLDPSSSSHLQPSVDSHPFAVPGAAFLCGTVGDFVNSGAELAVSAPVQPGATSPYVVTRIEPDGTRILLETLVEPTGRVRASVSQPGKYSVLRRLPSGGVYLAKDIQGSDLTLIAGPIGDFVARYKNQSLVGRIDEHGDYQAMNDRFAVTGRAKLVGGKWVLDGQLSETGVAGSRSFSAPPPPLVYKIANGPAPGSSQMIDATPQMPAITATAEETTGANVDCGKVTFQWELKLTHKPSSFGDTNGPAITVYADFVRDSGTGQTYMLANRTTLIRGGKAKLSLKVKFEGVDLATQPQALEFEIQGTNPDSASIDGAGGDTNLSKIISHESSNRQFNGGKPLWSGDGNQGVGLGQITPYTAFVASGFSSIDNVWNWRANVAASLKKLNSARTTSQNMAASAVADVNSTEWGNFVTKFNNAFRIPQGLPALTAVSAPAWTADMIERNAVRGYNGWAGNHFMFPTSGRRLPEWTVLDAAKNHIDIDLGPNPNTATTGVARWRKVLGSERPNVGDPNYTDNVLGP